MARFGSGHRCWAPCVAFALLAWTPAHAGRETVQTLKDAYSGLFRIGVAVNNAEVEGRDSTDAIIKEQFNSISPENALKWQSIHPSPGKYDFEAADRYVDFGTHHKMFVVGHCLVWHSQTPGWVFRDEDGKPLSREALLERMHDHIRNVVGRYKGRVGGWDVVNEALNDDGTLRRSPWLQIIGDDYLPKAFEYAHEADPAAELYYNDYSLENDAKRRGAVELIRKLRTAGVPISGVGLQGHVRIDSPSPDKEAQTIEDFAALGIKVNISELDVDVLPRTSKSDSADISAVAAATAASDPYRRGLPDAVQQQLARRYADLFRVFAEHHEAMGRVTFWGVSDATSWLNNFPTRGRVNYPLLFDRGNKPKPAFAAVLAIGESYRKTRLLPDAIEVER